jgi:hypothetical protein
MRRFAKVNIAQWALTATVIVLISMNDFWDFIESNVIGQLIPKIILTLIILAIFGHMLRS